MALGDFLQVVRPHLDDALVGNTAWSRVMGLALELGDSGYAGLECRLGPRQPQVDLQVNLPPGVPVLPSRLAVHPAGRRLMAFCEEWSEPDGRTNSVVSDLWLEFDLRGVAPDKPIPAVFLALRPSSSIATEVAYILRPLLPRPLPMRLLGTLEGCVAALPEGCRVSHVGLMLSREPELLRVNVEGLTWDLLCDYLIAARWPGPLERCKMLTTLLAGPAERLVVALDLARTIRPVVGLECGPARSGPKYDPAWSALIETMVTAGFCTREKADALTTWCGFNWRSRQGTTWPASIEWADRFMSARAESAIARFINHVKVVVEPSGRCEAKAYLAYRHLWVDRSDTP